VSASDLRRAAKIAPISALQVEYSPFVLDIEGPESGNLLATARELGVAIVCYAPMGRGMVTSVFAANNTPADPKDMRAKALPRFMDENREKNVTMVRQLQNLAEKKGCNVSQLALAWLMKQGDDIVPIPGTKQLKYLEDNWAALDVQLSDEDQKEIRALVEQADIAGDVMPPGKEGVQYRTTVAEP
jgi:aryl-alcohol dehydrogenase-like predicted oxidoreductase